MIKVLLLDDINKGSAMYMHNNLEFCIERFTAALPAFNYIIKNIPEAIIINMENRELDSVAVYNRIRNMVVAKNIPIVLIGGKSEQIGELVKDELTEYIEEDKVNDKVLELLTGILEVTPQEKNKKVLLVDDNPVVLDTVKMYLEAYYQVDALTSANLAIEYLEKQVPDIIILDIAMPEMDGIELLKKIKCIPKCSKVPVIFQTGLATMEKVKECMSLGANGYIVKPVNKNTLLERIANALEGEIEVKNILFIDTYPVSTANLENVLYKGCRVIGEEIGVVALSAIEEKKIDYIFLNIDNCAAYMDRIREKASRKNLPIVLITSNTSGENAGKELYGECKGIIKTPFVKEEVEKILEKLAD